MHNIELRVRALICVFSVFLMAATMASCGGGAGTSTSVSRSIGGSSAITIAIPASANGDIGFTYNVQLTATGGTAPYTWTITTGSLPPGLTMSSSGMITGTPTQTGNYSVNFHVTDAGGLTGDKQLTISIAAVLSAAAPSRLNGTIGAPYSAQFTTTGGTQPFSWTLSSGSLPAGLFLNGSTGLISGTPTAAGTSKITLHVTDPVGGAADVAATIVISPPVAITTGSLPSGGINSPYSTQLTATGGSGALTWSIVAGALPPGIGLNSASGLLSGTPTSSGNYQFTVKASDSFGASSQQQFTLSVFGGPAITSIFPFSANAAGGASVTITGVLFQSGAAVTFGGVAATNTTVDGTGTSITLTVPPHATGKVDVIVTNPDSTSTVMAQGFLYGDVAGCGTDCGNVGDPYEGAGAPSGQTPISSCNTNITTGGNYVLTQNIGSDATATCLKWFFPSSSVNLDLGGHTVTGQIDISNTNQGLNVIQNGIINCSMGAGCLVWPTTGHIHHLTITNSAGLLGVLGSIGINVVGTESVTASYLGLHIDHDTVTISATPNANRTEAIRVSGANGSNASIRSMSIEADHNNVTCSDNASACQGFELFATIGSLIHNNTFTLPSTCTLCTDTARATIFDTGGMGEFSFNTVTTLSNRGIRTRNLSSSAAGNLPIFVHDNSFLHVTTAGRLAAVHIGENDTNLNTTPVNVYNNNFELGPAGNGVVVSAADNVTVRSNTVTCFNNDCTGVGFFALTDVPNTYASTGTDAIFSNNNVAPLTNAGLPSIKVCGVPGNVLYECSAQGQATTSATVCSSGTVVGNGTINVVSPPCP